MHAIEENMNKLTYPILFSEFYHLTKPGRGETEEEVMKNGIEHAKNARNMKEEDITPEIRQKIKGLIRSS